MFIDSPKSKDFPEEQGEIVSMKTFFTPGMPKPEHPAIAGPFSRLEGIPGYRPEGVRDASIALIGAGGLNSWTGLGIVRTGLCKHLTILDHDKYDLSNTNRQLAFAQDIGKEKAFVLARNLAPHAVRQTFITALALPFEEAIHSHRLAVDLAVFGVDNAHCRLTGAIWARQNRTRATFTMTSAGGTRCESFLQGPNPTDACLHCCLPDLDANRSMPCAFASISICLLASAYAVFFVERALMGWDEETVPFNWRYADLRGLDPEETGLIDQRPDCPTCSKLK